MFNIISTFSIFSIFNIIREKSTSNIYFGIEHIMHFKELEVDPEPEQATIV